MKELFTALTLAQAEMENASKDSANPFFKSKYADLNSVMGAIKPALAKHGLAFVQKSQHMDNAACVETIILHESGQEYPCGPVSVPVGKHDAQGYGSALTYARRYSLAAAFGVGAEDDDGNAATKAAPKAELNVTPTAGTWEALSEDERTWLNDLANDVKALIRSGDIEGAVFRVREEALDADKSVALVTRFDSKERTAMKKEQEKQKQARELAIQP